MGRGGPEWRVDRYPGRADLRNQPLAPFTSCRNPPRIDPYADCEGSCTHEIARSSSRSADSGSSGRPYCRFSDAGGWVVEEPAASLWAPLRSVMAHPLRPLAGSAYCRLCATCLWHVQGLWLVDAFDVVEEVAGTKVTLSRACRSRIIV